MRVLTSAKRLSLNGEGDLDVVLLFALAQESHHDLGSAGGREKRREGQRVCQGWVRSDVREHALIDGKDDVLHSSLEMTHNSGLCQLSGTGNRDDPGSDLDERLDLVKD